MCTTTISFFHPLLFFLCTFLIFLLYYYELFMNKVDQKLLDDWGNMDLLGNYDLEILYYDWIPDDLIPRHAQIHTALSNDIKRLDYSWTVMKDAAYTKNRQQLLRLEGKQSRIIYLVDNHQHIIGLTKIVYDPKKPDKICQTITGVTRAYRGKGLTKFLKARMIKKIREDYLEVEVVETDCLRGNLPMISINEKLGFHRKNVPPEVEIIL